MTENCTLCGTDRDIGPHSHCPLREVHCIAVLSREQQPDNQTTDIQTSRQRECQTPSGPHHNRLAGSARSASRFVLICCCLLSITLSKVPIASHRLSRQFFATGLKSRLQVSKQADSFFLLVGITMR